MFTRKRYAAFSLLMALVMALSFVAVPRGARAQGFQPMSYAD